MTLGEARPSVDTDGVRTFALTPARLVLRWAALASAGVVAVTLVVVLGLRLTGGDPPRDRARPLVALAIGDPPARDGATAQAPAPARAAASTTGVRPQRRTPRAAPPAPAPAEDAAEPLPELHATEVIPILLEAGERGGIAAFNPPGTKPIKRGILVPEGFELPEGYVRHYQATDDGKRVPAILMVHPDYDLVDAHGVAVPMPPDRVVPPELAPAGLPIEMLALPEPADATHSVR